QELLQTTIDFHSCGQKEGQLVSSYVLKMKGYIDNLERLGHPVTLGLGVSLILIGLRKEYDGFVWNYNMHSMGKTVNDLHAMLKLHEQTLPKSNAPAIHTIRAAELMKKKKNAASGAGGPGLRASRKLKPGAFSLYVSNGQREAVEAIGAFYLYLPSGLEIVLNNCHYAPSITTGVIYVSRLYEDGFVNRFVDNTIQVSRNNVVYFSDVPRDGIFEIDLSNSLINESSIYAVSNNRAKLDLDSALLWHCRLGHISKKRIEKLQHDGLLDSSDLRAFDKCVSCMSGKIARKPYTHQVERAKDLLGLIHTDHKHEVFETFKVFQKEVENQLGKTIKSLRSNRGGEYTSQEFLDHLKYHEIIASYSSLHSTTQWCVGEEKQNPTGYGYPKETMGNSFYYPPENKVLVARNAKFLENSLINQEASGGLEDLEIFQEEDTHPSLDTSLNHEEDDLEIDEPQSDIIPVHRSTRTRHSPDHPESEKWLNAMNMKMQSMKDNEVRVFVELPPNGKTVGSYTQTPRIDYEETFSPVADIRAIRILIAIASYYDYEIWQMDVKTAFLNGYLNVDVYMEQPEGFVNPKYPNRHMQNVPYASVVGSIMCSKTRAQVSCYTDVGYLTDADDLKSQTGYVFILNGGDVDWKSAKKSIFATSSAEAEYIASFDASKEVVWVRKFIFGLGVVPIIEEPISMYSDNTGAIAIDNESGITKGARYFRAKVHYIREVIEFEAMVLSSRMVCIKFIRYDAINPLKNNGLQLRPCFWIKNVGGVTSFGDGIERETSGGRGRMFSMTLYARRWIPRSID
nr:hypothetical protein [Tanacetum cinerariifolium]